MNRDHHKTCIRPVGIGRLCGAQATREFCYAAEPWMPYCDEHEPQYATAGERPIRKVGDSTPPATPASLSPVEPTPEPPTEELKTTPGGALIFRHVCGTPEDDGECMACSQIDCPDGEPLHYHHDGCPCCSQKPTLEPPPDAQVCVWREREWDYESGCRGTQISRDERSSGPPDGWKHCPYCGKRLVVGTAPQGGEQ